MPKEPEEGACPDCRKSVPLVPTRGGSFVLRTHHVVVADLYYSGHGVIECTGSAGEPATLDDSEDWGWVAEPTAMRQVDGDTVTAVAAVGQPLPPFENGGLSLGEAIRAVTTEIAEEQPEPAGVLLPDIDFAAAVAAVDVPPVPDFMGTVLTELRQAWIDVTGAPPDDANVTLSTPDFVWDMRVMDFVFQPYGLHVSIPIHGNAPDLPGFAEAAGRQAGETMRTLLRARLARCNATRGLFPCECNHPDREPHQHRCGICGLLWRDPVTPTTSMERER